MKRGAGGSWTAVSRSRSWDKPFTGLGRGFSRGIIRYVPNSVLQLWENVEFRLTVRQLQPQTSFAFYERMTAPIPINPTIIYVHILSEVVNSRLVPLSEKGILALRGSGLRKRGCY